MSPFVEPRARPIGNTFIIEEERECDSPRRVTVSGLCKRRHSYNHRAHCHSALRVERSSLLDFARTLPPKAETLPRAAREEAEEKKCGGAEAEAPPRAAKEEEARGGAEVPTSEEPAVRVVKLSLAVPEVAEQPPRSLCQASAPLELPAAALFQVNGHILSTPGPLCSPSAQAFFLGSSPAHRGGAFGPMGTGNYCCGTAPAACSPMMWVPDGARAAHRAEEPRSPVRKPDIGVPCLPLQSLIPPPSPAATAETSVPWSPAGSSDAAFYSSEGNVSVESTPSAHSAAASEAPSRRRGRRVRGPVGAAPATPVGAAPAKAAAPIGSPPAAAPGAGSLAQVSAGPIGAPARQQPRDELVRELLRTGASALERASALAKELGSGPKASEPRRR